MEFVDERVLLDLCWIVSSKGRASMCHGGGRACSVSPSQWGRSESGPCARCGEFNSRLFMLVWS
ncbi:MAG: hypothetical protein ACRD0Q_05700, partial [Acidimicrobiales bacterium]